MNDNPASRSRPRNPQGLSDPVPRRLHRQRTPDEPTQELPRIGGAHDIRARRANVPSSTNGRPGGRPAMNSAPYTRSGGQPLDGPRYDYRGMSHGPIRGIRPGDTDSDAQVLDAGLYARQMAGIAALVAIANEVATASRSSRPGAVEGAGAGPGQGRLLALFTRLHRDHMMWNSLYLMLNAVLQAGFGFTFWIIAAHLFSASEVGKASTLIAASGVIGYLALLGLNNGMGKYLPTACDRDALISSGLAVVATFGAVIAVGYIFLTPFIAPRLAFVEKSPALTAGFALITAAGALNVLTDSVFIASRRAKYAALVDGIIGGSGKNILVVVLAGAGTYALFVASAMGIVLAAASSIVIIFTIMRCRPRLNRPLNTLKPLLRFSTANYVGNVFNMIPTLAVPVIVLDRQGAASAGYFFVVFQLASIVYAAALAMEQTFLAEGSRANSDMRRLKRRSLRILAMLCVPAVLGLIAAGRWLLLAFGWRYYHYGLPSLVILALSAGPVSANYWLLSVLRLEGKLSAIVIVNLTYAVGVCTLAWVGAAHGLTGVAIGWLVGAFIAACVAAAAIPGERHARDRRHAGSAAGTTSAHALRRNTAVVPRRSLSISNLKQKAMGIPSEQRW